MTKEKVRRLVLEPHEDLSAPQPRGSYSRPDPTNRELSSTAHPSPTLTWTYRVAQNPRFKWILGMSALLVLAALMLEPFFADPDGGSLTHLCGALAYSSLIIVTWSVAGFPPILRIPIMDAQVKRVPSNALWFLHIPLCVAMAGIGFGVILELEPPATIESIDDAYLYMVLIGGYVLIAIVALSFIVAGYHRVLEFRPDGLLYERGWFRAFIPWAAVDGLRPVADANVKRTRDVSRPSRFNFRAGVQITIRDDAGAETHRETMLHRINDRTVIGVDCSSYRIDPNTLINAIYLLTHDPDLRARLDHPSGAEIFDAPSWNTRRKMRVGDTWDRRTDEIVPASDRYTT